MITPAHVQQHGYTTFIEHITNDPKRRPYDERINAANFDAEKHNITVWCGLQRDGTYLYFLDLDSHQAHQNARNELDRVLASIDYDLAKRLAIRVSQSGEGFHIQFKTLSPITQHKEVKLFNPDTSMHVGEFIGNGYRATFSGTYLQGSFASIPLLHDSQLEALLSCFTIPALQAPGIYSASNDDNDSMSSHCSTPRKKRLHEGLSLITGWERIKSASKQLDALCRNKPNVNSYRVALRTAPDRSNAYMHFVQSLMLHAYTLGCDVPERCRRVAALAISEGANGKECEKGYKIELDTAVLIARILNGDSYLNDTTKCFTTPRWAQGYADTPTNAPATPASTSTSTPTSVPGAPGRPPGAQQQATEDLYSILETINLDALGQRCYTLATLASAMKKRFKKSVSVRTVSRHLSMLHEQGRITKPAQLNKNGNSFCLLDVDLGTPIIPQKRVKKQTESPSIKIIIGVPELSFPTPKSEQNENIQIIMHRDHQKDVDAPTAVCAPGLYGGVAAFGDPFLHTCADPFWVNVFGDVGIPVELRVFDYDINAIVDLEIAPCHIVDLEIASCHDAPFSVDLATPNIPYEVDQVESEPRWSAVVSEASAWLLDEKQRLLNAGARHDDAHIVALDSHIVSLAEATVAPEHRQGRQELRKEVNPRQVSNNQNKALKTTYSETTDVVCIPSLNIELLSCSHLFLYSTC